jgi:hypothetical protein
MATGAVKSSLAIERDRLRATFAREAGAGSSGCATGTQAVVFAYESRVLEPGDTSRFDRLFCQRTPLSTSQARPGTGRTGVRLVVTAPTTRNESDRDRQHAVTAEIQREQEGSDGNRETHQCLFRASILGKRLVERRGANEFANPTGASDPAPLKSPFVRSLVQRGSGGSRVGCPRHTVIASVHGDIPAL